MPATIDTPPIDTPPIDLAPILALSADERVLIAHAILDSVTAEAEAAPLTDAMKAELDRRLAAYRADPSRVVPWEQVKAAAQARRRK